MKRILTGIKPTGYAHIGNYFGAIKPSIEFSNSTDNECFYFIADYHALTTIDNREDLIEYTYYLASTWLACGLDPNKVVFFKQSDVPEVFELNWILNNVTPKGLMNRAHAYKAMVEKNQENNIDVDSGVNMGLYNYPILMAADILLYQTNLVPIGLDQKQHIEITRDIATYFNNKFGKALTLPEEFLTKNAYTIVGLDGRKMSKSYSNTIRLFGTEQELKKGINRIITDSRLPGEPKDLDCTVNKLYKIFATESEQIEFENKLKNGLSWGEAKKELFEKVNTFIAPMREKFNYYYTNRDVVDKILLDGAKKARVIAQETLNKIKYLIGAKNEK